jgi:hypothetical protein
VLLHLATSVGEHVREWGTAIGTLGATLAAVWVIFGGRRPKLRLTYVQREYPDVLPVPEHTGLKHKTQVIAYNHLTVTNTKRLAGAAVDVEVFLKEVEVVEPFPGQKKQRFGLGDMALKWSNSSPESTRSSVAPRASRRVDFLRVEDGLDQQGNLPLVVDVRPEPHNQLNHVRGARLRFEVLVTASNADAAQYTVIVDWDGRFAPGSLDDVNELYDHLGIGSPQPL